MPPGSKNPDPFRELKWSDLQAWAGEKAISEGMTYQDEERVREIKRTPKGGLFARVQGTGTYFTEIFLENGKLGSTCTCQAGGDCKHGVAAVLEYLELTEQGEEVPVISEEDLLLARAGKGQIKAEPTEVRKAIESSPQDLREYLEQLTKQELIEILLAFAEKAEVTDRRTFLKRDEEEKN